MPFISEEKVVVVKEEFIINEMKKLSEITYSSLNLRNQVSEFPGWILRYFFKTYYTRLMIGDYKILYKFTDKIN